MRFFTSVLVLTAVLECVSPIQASVTSRAIREAMEFVGKKFGKEVAEEGAGKVARRMSSLAAKHGDEFVSAAFRKVGPKAGKLVSEAGEHADTAVKLLAKYGDDGAALMARPASLKLVSQYGDEATEALLRHGTVGEQVIGQFAEHGAKALTQLNPQNGRRLAMLASEGVAKPEMVDVVCRYGDRACEFLWKNKGALAVGSTLAMFVSNPEPFLDGSLRLTDIVADSAVRPLAEEAGRHYGGTILIIGMIVVALAFVVLSVCMPRRSLFGLAGAWITDRLRKQSPSSAPKV